MDKYQASLTPRRDFPESLDLPLTDIVLNISARLYHAKHEEDFFKAKYLMSMVPALIIHQKSGERSRRDFNTRFHMDLITLWNADLYDEVWAKAMKEQNKRKSKPKKKKKKGIWTVDTKAKQ